MKKTLIVLIAVLGFALQASALDIKAIAAKPTADNPQYDNKKAWPTLVGDEYFLKQKWPKARLLIWVHPGETGRGTRAYPVSARHFFLPASGGFSHTSLRTLAMSGSCFRTSARTKG